MKSTGDSHNSIMGSWNVSDGYFRLHDVTEGIGGRSYVNFQKVSGLITTFCELINRQLSLVRTMEEKYSLSFKAQVDLLAIHPWYDGNGLTSRLLMNYIQLYTI